MSVNFNSHYQYYKRDPAPPASLPRTAVINGPVEFYSTGPGSRSVGCSRGGRKAAESRRRSQTSGKNPLGRSDNNNNNNNNNNNEGDNSIDDNSIDDNNGNDNDNYYDDRATILIEAMTTTMVTMTALTAATQT